MDKNQALFQQSDEEKNLAQQVALLEAKLEQRDAELTALRKQSEEASRESEERFRIALSNSPIMVYTTDLDLRYTWIYNPRVGFKAEQVMGKRDDELLPPEDAADLIALKQQVLDQGVGLRRELAVRAANDVGHYDIAVEPMHNGAGRLTGLTVAVAEITEQVRLRQQREETYALLDALFDSAPIGLALVDRNLRFARVNPALAAINGLTTAAHLGKTLPELLPRDESEQIQAVWRRIMASGVASVGVEVTGTTPATGAKLHTWSATWYPIRLNGESIGLGEVLEDVTERKQAEEALRMSERNYRALASNLPSGAAFLVDMELRYLVAEGQALDLVGMSPADLEGKTIWEALDPETAEHNAYYYRQALNGESFQEEHTSFGRYYISRGSPLRNEQGEVYAVLVVSYDITERKQIELELQEMAATLEMRVRERTHQVENLASKLSLAEQVERKRISNILHDHVQQILYGIQIEMHMLSQDLPPARTEAVDDHLVKLTEMVKSALQATRTLAVELSPPVLDSGGIVEAVHWLAHHMQGTHGLSVTIEIEGDCQVVDRNQRMLLFQILRELLFNVVKHAGVDRASVRLCRESNTFTVTVSDEGNGFVVTASTSTPSLTVPTGFGLIGLGERLAIARGTLLVQSAPGQGTQVTVTLPLFGVS